MNYSRIKTYIDIFFYCAFLPMIIALVPVGKWIMEYPGFAITLIIFLYALYFSFQKMNLPQKFMKRQYLQIAIFMFMVLGLTLLISRFPYPPEVLKAHENPVRVVRLRIQTVWFMSLLVIGFSLAISLLFELFRQILIKRDLEKKKTLTELALYKAQINPHFLFNTLNTLYGLVVCKSDKAEEAFIRFSSLIKYTYMREGAEKVALSEETGYIRNYIELQRLRLGSHTSIKFSASSNEGNPMIPPMILISFIENAFKYGTSALKDSEISISISYCDNVMKFYCANDIINKLTKKSDEPIGLGNTLARLERIYPGRFHLNAREIGKKFIVELQIRC